MVVGQNMATSLNGLLVVLHVRKGHNHASNQGRVPTQNQSLVENTVLEMLQMLKSDLVTWRNVQVII
jgi:hypothetical protein